MKPMPASSPHPLLSMAHVDKSFAGVAALRDVSLQLRRGEVLALVGENGAGKSTLIKILGGAVVPDRGEVLVDGAPLSVFHPLAAQAAGVAIIYQEFNLVGELSVSENVFLGREPTRWGVVDQVAQRRATVALMERLDTNVDPAARCGRLSIAQQQYVEIAKALCWEAKIVVMDEPTAALTGREVDRLLEIVRELKRQGLGIIYISHRLEEVFDVADRVMVLRDGRTVGEYAIDDVTEAKLIEAMVGRPLEAEFPPRQVELGEERLRVEHLSRKPVVRDVSFSLRAGEVLGIGGLSGSGRTEMVRLIFGADAKSSGQIFIEGREATIRQPRDAIGHRICLLTEDRKAEGLVLGHSVQDNFGLPNLGQFLRGPFVDGRRERDAFRGYAERLNLKTAGPAQPAAHLSGGNQQKLVLAKWLARNTDVVIFDEPTRGIDVGAKYEIYLLINNLVQEGKAVIMISSEIPELLGMSDRILVMHQGRVAGEITDVTTATQEDVLELSMTRGEATT